ncbi:hypothetical protein EG68_05837 [Paragonimus skrjabini miyazakii]|uniref:Major facilitator superfamily (MFS) profile domain-containing protein n=1 Tax=Paragonimus skrjabini miyazakii TaxID=59628 RepID=A0A8S9YW58_9TREM|nr:hypothetical protein EG68_05837 [Paragonimus skrjabini miyazakii]
MARRRLTSLNELPQAKKTCLSTPTVYHAAIVVFLEFFAFGLLTTPMISVLDETFPKHTFLMNGIIQGVKGFLSFLSAPLLGALSDAIGRKPFLLLTVTFTCSPIPLMKISHWWYFTMISISGIFAVTFSVVLAYVADITTEDERSWGYGLVSATFAASLVSSPAIGAYLGRVYSEDLVVALATAIAFLDIFFIMACVPESLPEKVRASHLCSIAGRGSGGPGSGNSSGKLSWDKVDPFAALRKVSNDYLVLIVCITTFFSYLPEAGQYSCFFVYLRLVMGFSEENVALFIAVGGILSCIAQTLFLNLLNNYVGPKRAIIIGLVFEAIQLTLYGFATQPVLLWSAGLIAAMGTVTYPALSAFVSKHAAADQQGVAQGLITGIRGLCGGLGPALFGLIFYIFRVDLNSQTSQQTPGVSTADTAHFSAMDYTRRLHEQLIPGPPFAFGALLVLLAIFVSWFIPENPKATITTIPLTSSSLNDGASVGPVVVKSYEGQRLRRCSPTTTELGEFSASFDFDHDDVYDSSKAFLMDTKSHSRQSCLAATKDHSVIGSETGLWDRLMSGWSSTDRRRVSANRRTNRLFRQPTVSFTRAHFVEPFRRLFTGLSTTTATTKSGTIRFDCAQLPILASHGDELNSGNMFVSGSVNLLQDKHTQVRNEFAEAADLSNYRSYNLKQFLANSITATTNDPITVTSSNTDRITAHRFDAQHYNRPYVKPRNLLTAVSTSSCSSCDMDERRCLLSGSFAPLEENEDSTKCPHATFTSLDSTIRTSMTPA